MPKKKSSPGARVSDLKDHSGSGPHAILHCACCGGEFSANKSDYFMLPPDHEFTCDGEDCDNLPLLLVRKRVVYEEVR